MTEQDKFILKAIKSGKNTGHQISYAARDAGINNLRHCREWADSRLRRLRAVNLVTHTGEKDRIGARIHALTEWGEQALREHRT